MSLKMLICDCGAYQVFNDDIEDVNCCFKCGNSDVDYRENISYSEDWRMICLARYVIKKGTGKEMAAYLARMENRNGKRKT